MPIRVVVLDTLPVTSMGGDGSQRLVGLHRALGSNVETVFVGCHDNPGEGVRELHRAPGLREFYIPLQLPPTATYAEMALREIALAEVVVLSRPWCFSVVQGALQPNHFVIYDASDVEIIAQALNYQDRIESVDFLESVAETELALCLRANLVLTSSLADQQLFSAIYAVPQHKQCVVQNDFLLDGQKPAIQVVSGWLKNLADENKTKKDLVVNQQSIKRYIVKGLRRLGLYSVLHRIFQRIAVARKSSHTTPKPTLAPCRTEYQAALSPWARLMALRLEAARISMKRQVQ